MATVSQLGGQIQSKLVRVSLVSDVSPHLYEVLLGPENHLAANLYYASNTIIIAGYITLGILVVPGTAFKKRYTTIGGLVFFISCGLHHLHNITHAADNPVYGAISFQWPHVAIDIVQAIAVWVFAFGVFRETRYKTFIKQPTLKQLKEQLESS